MEKDDSADFEEMRRANSERLNQLEQLDAAGDLRSKERTERDIRAGIERFCRGTTATDGSWTVVNLVGETGVPRPTLYRYKRELALFQNMGAVAPSGGVREDLKRLRAEIAAERQAGKDERARHREAEAILVERIHALTMIVASYMGEDGVPALLDARRPKGGQP